jgi:hypothetical protein
LKNRQSLICRKRAGGGVASAMPIRFPLKANWYETVA